MRAHFRTQVQALLKRVRARAPTHSSAAARGISGRPPCPPRARSRGQHGVSCPPYRWHPSRKGLSPLRRDRSPANVRVARRHARAVSGACSIGTDARKGAPARSHRVGVRVRIGKCPLRPHVNGEEDDAGDRDRAQARTICGEERFEPRRLFFPRNVSLSQCGAAVRHGHDGHVSCARPCARAWLSILADGASAARQEEASCVRGWVRRTERKGCGAG